nr:MAG TPA: hypothetical protein [Caudoviricetes sp.]
MPGSPDVSARTLWSGVAYHHVGGAGHHDSCDQRAARSGGRRRCSN